MTDRLKREIGLAAWVRRYSASERNKVRALLGLIVRSYFCGSDGVVDENDVHRVHDAPDLDVIVSSGLLTNQDVLVYVDRMSRGEEERHPNGIPYPVWPLYMVHQIVTSTLEGDVNIEEWWPELEWYCDKVEDDACGLLDVFSYVFLESPSAVTENVSKSDPGANPLRVKREATKLVNMLNSLQNRVIRPIR
jgi:hypothetical protein